MQVVVVESPAKAKTVGRYLGDGYRVLATLGHVSDLPAKEGSVRPAEGFAMTYATGARARRALGRIAAALEDADGLILATDPDREGEAIAWQVLTWLRERGALGDRPVQRVAFHEITPDGVRAAMASPRALDMGLVRAQQARRALDYLVGFHLSPLLWRKLPGSRSAGRVQSVALRLVCEREAEIEAFVPREYWTVEAGVMADGGGRFTAELIEMDGAVADRLALESGSMAEAAAERIRAARFTVGTVECREVRRNPPPPFTTSSLQQEASRKLGFDVQQDHAGGPGALRVRQRFGGNYLPGRVRGFRLGAGKPDAAALPAEPDAAELHPIAEGPHAGDLRTDEVVARIWIAPFVDADGVYREASHVRVVLEPARWRLGR